jgi:ABC-type Fe3+-siderophore transport system permease subunit
MNVVTTSSDHATDSPLVPLLGERDLPSSGQRTAVLSQSYARISIGGLAICTVLGFLLQSGAEAISFTKSIQVLLSVWFPTHQGVDQFDAEATILLHLRAPRLLLALCVGTTI